MASPLFYPLSIASLSGIIYALWELKQCYSSYQWPATDGEIIQSKIGSPSNTKTQYPYIYYKYDVNGKEHISRRLGMHIAYPTDKAELERLLTKYPLGKKVTVKYHPVFHAHAVLEPGPVQLPIYFAFLFLLLIIFVFSTTTIILPEYNIFFEIINYLIP